MEMDKGTRNRANEGEQQTGLCGEEPVQTAERVAARLK